MKVVFIGAGPGAADLLTLRGAAAIGAAEIVIWAASLVHPSVLDHARPGTRIVDSATLTLEETLALYTEARDCDVTVARIHSGDPSLWGALHEQLTACRSLGVPTEVIPGVSSFTAAAAAVQRELTVPEVAQSVILTRLEGGKTPMPARESIRTFAEHGTTMAIFLSAARSGQLASELAAGGYAADTPIVVAYQVTWPDELILRCDLSTLEETVKAYKLWKHTLFLVGWALSDADTRSHLYHPGHFHGFRRADPVARKELRATRG